MMMITFIVPKEKERTVTGMAEYIACRSCESPDCKGCNLKRLETMLENGKFDCLMNENRAINISADVEPVKRGSWGKVYKSKVTVTDGYVSSCCDMWNERRTRYCPNCGADMRGINDE